MRLPAVLQEPTFRPSILLFNAYRSVLGSKVRGTVVFRGLKVCGTIYCFRSLIIIRYISDTSILCCLIGTLLRQDTDTHWAVWHLPAWVAGCFMLLLHHAVWIIGRQGNVYFGHRLGSVDCTSRWVTRDALASTKALWPFGFPWCALTHALERPGTDTELYRRGGFIVNTFPAYLNYNTARSRIDDLKEHLVQPYHKSTLCL